MFTNNRVLQFLVEAQTNRREIGVYANGLCEHLFLENPKNSMSNIYIL